MSLSKSGYSNRARPSKPFLPKRVGWTCPISTTYPTIGRPILPCYISELSHSVYGVCKETNWNWVNIFCLFLFRWIWSTNLPPLRAHVQYSMQSQPYGLILWWGIVLALFTTCVFITFSFRYWRKCIFIYHSYLGKLAAFNGILLNFCLCA